jgi:hypothetical protein
MQKLAFSILFLLCFSCAVQAMDDGESLLSDEELALLLSIPDKDTPPEDLIPEDFLSEDFHSISSSSSVNLVSDPYGFSRIDTSLREILLQKTFFLFEKEQEYLIAQFNAIDQKLRTIPNNSDVHILDAFVFGADNKIQELANIGAALDLDNSHHTLQEIGRQMIAFVDQCPDLFAEYEYENTKVSSEKIKEYLHLHFSQMDQEILAANCPNAQIIWSRAFSLVFDLFNFENDISGIKMLYDSAIEGHLTQGGCLAGRINRGFVLYVSLLGKYGLGNIQ